MLVFWFDAGATYVTQAAGLGRQTGTFDIARVRLTDAGEDGDSIDYGFTDEFPRVSRYYQTGLSSMFNSYVSSGATYYITTDLPVPLRDRLTASVALTNASNSAFPATPGPTTLYRATHLQESRVANATSASGYFYSNYVIDNRLT
jgi:hypothetical protein